MKLLIATDRDFWKADIGSRKRIAQLCSYLGASGLEVHLFLTFTGKAYLPEKITAIQQQFGFRSIRFFTPEQPERFSTGLKKRIMRTIRGTLRSTADSGTHERTLPEFTDSAVKTQFDRFVAEIAPDVILIEYIRLAYLADKLPPGVRTLIDTHDVMHLRYASFQKIGKSHWLKISKQEEVDALNRFDAVLAIQEREKEYLRDILSPDTTVLQVGMDTVTEFLPEPSGPCLPIGFIGAHGIPNVDGITAFIDRVWPRLADNHGKAVKLLVAGSICDILAQRQLGSGIELLGIVDNVTDFYRQVAIIINPVTFGGGLKIKTVEALAYGKPLVSTPVGAVGLEDGAGNAFLIAADEDEFFHQLAELIASPEQRLMLAGHALEYAGEHFSAAAIYRELADFLELRPGKKLSATDMTKQQRHRSE